MKKLFVIFVCLVFAIVTIAGAWSISIDGQQPGDLLYVNSSGAIDRLAAGENDQVLTVTNGIPTWAETDITCIADNILYKDSTGYHALRTEDNTIMSSNATDFAGCWNEMCRQIRTYYNPSDKNLYVPGINPNGFKEGRRIVSMVAEGLCYTTLEIPPLQDQVIDFSKMVIQGMSGVSTVISIDSTENSLINLPLIFSNVNNAVLVYVFPQTVAPDNSQFISCLTLNIEALVSTEASNIVGLLIYAPGNNIPIISSQFNIKEINVGTNSCTGVKIQTPGTGSVVLSNTFEILWKNTASNVLVIETTSAVYMNDFFVNMYDGSAPIVNNNSGTPQNIIRTLPLPTTDPNVDGQWWNNSGTLSVSSP